MPHTAPTDASLLRAFFDRAPVGLGLLDTSLRFVRVNPALAEINGIAVGDHAGRRPSELLGALGERVEIGFRTVLETGDPVAVELSGTTPAAPGVERHWSASYYPVRDDDGRLEGVGAVVVDVSDRRRAEADRERLRRRAEFLADSAETLASSLDFDATIRAVVEAAVPDLGDWCACTVVEGDEVRLLALARADAADAPLEDAVRARWPQPLDADAPVPTAIRTHRPFLSAVDGTIEQLRPLADLGATSVLAVPLVTPTGVVGALGLLSTRSGRLHGPEELETAQALADRAAVAIAHARAHSTAQERLALLDALFDSAPVGIAFVDDELRYRRVNDTLAAINGHAAEAHLARRPTEVLGRDLGAPVEAMLRTVLADGARSGEVLTADDRAFLATFAPVALEGHRLGVSGVILDITERKRDEARERLLGRIGEAIDAEFEVAAAAQRLCDLLAAELDAGCAVRLRGTPADLLVHAGEGQPGGGELVVPLATRGRTIGTVRLTGGARPLDAEDDRVLRDVARRAALSLDNLMLYAGHKEIASTLQSRLLPGRIPEVPGVDVAARYRAAGEHNEVGGDFYDVFRGPGAQWTALVGDVAGKGAEAAALTASIRQIVRTGSRWCDDAVELLGVVNDELLADADARTCTLAYAALHEEGDALRVVVTLAGHPQPLVLRRDGRVETAGRHGTLLGGVRGVDLRSAETVLHPGDLVLLHTDGALEVRRGGELLDLAAVLARCAGATAVEVVRAVEEAAVAAAGGTPPDDIALVCLRRRP